MQFRFPRFVPLVLAAGLLLMSCHVPLFAAEPPRACAGRPALGVPDWIRQETIYEINVRQFSAAGDFAGVEAQLPRLHELGVGVLWLMPIHPIGEQNRKGPLGSYYSVRDYRGINPDFGTTADFKRLVDAAHAQGFRVILDWVGNHTAWDNPLAREHPDYYVRDAAGHFQPPTGFDWTDVIQLDFSNPGVLEMEYDAMAYWIRDFGVDGFRCDFATGVPTAFWDALAARLRALRPDLFLLAESDLPQQQLHAFNTSYAFEMMHAFNDVAAGRSPVSRIDDTLARSRVQLPDGGSLIYYTTNHDENSWQGTAFERLGRGANTFAVLSFVLDGIPLIYDGQETGLNRRLKFFERDPIDWKPDPAQTALYRRLCALHRTEPALATGATMRRVPTTLNASLYALLRERDGHRVLALFNLTGQPAKADAYDPAFHGAWIDAFTGARVELSGPVAVDLPAWGWRVLVAAPEN